MSEGAVWLHRKLTESDIWTSGSRTIHVMLACLFLANWREQRWFNRSIHKPQIIPRGSFVTTFDRLAAYCRLSTQNVRTSLANLEKMEFLTRTLTGKVTQITILKYDTYQKVPTRKVTDRLTTHQQLTNNSLTRLEEVKEVKERKEEGRPPVFSLSEFTAFWSDRPEYEKDAAKIAMGLKAYKLSFRVEEDIYNKIMGKGENNETLRSKSISEQVAERRRTQGLKSVREDTSGRTLLDKLGIVPKIPPQT